MAEDRSGFSKGLVIGFLVGGAVGAITALLYAPKSGKELRGDIKQKAASLAEDANEYMKVAKAKTTEFVNKGLNRSDELVAEAKQQAGHILDDAEKVLNGIRERANAEPGKVKAAFRAGMDTYRAEKDRDRS